MGFYANKGGRTLEDDKGEDSVDVAVCTIEKANNLINSLMERSNKLDDIGIVVIDEIHMMSDEDRGYILELLITKLRYISSPRTGGIQIVGLSATLPNIDSFSKWLNASLYVTDYRPVPLEEYVKIGDEIYDKEGKVIRKVLGLGPSDPSGMGTLCAEVVRQGNSVLVFCASKNETERVCKQIAQMISQGTASNPP